MENPIGVFDSGIGGLTLLPALTSLLPYENIIYIADEAHSPYGKKSQKELLERAHIITKELMEQGCKLILVACNTATTQVIGPLRNEFKLPFVGIEPGIKPAAQHTKSRVIGVLATQGTLTSPMYAERANYYKKEITIVEQIGHGLVNCIEENKLDTAETKTHLETLLSPMVNAGMDTLLLGCTHYLFLVPLLHKILPAEVTIIDNSEAVSHQVKRVLSQQNLLNTITTTGEKKFYSTQKRNRLEKFVEQKVNYLPL